MLPCVDPASPEGFHLGTSCQTRQALVLSMQTRPSELANHVELSVQSPKRFEIQVPISMDWTAPACGRLPTDQTVFAATPS